jgi:hypothetical protein
MASLYNFQQSLVDGKISPRVLEEISDMKAPIRDNWEQCIIFLQKCHTFGGDIATLNGIIVKPAMMKECLELLMEMKNTSEEFVRDSERLHIHSTENSKRVETFVSNFPGQYKKRLSKRAETSTCNDLVPRFFTKRTFFRHALLSLTHFPRIFGYLL